MDLNFDHKAWVGDICQRFEDICQQVDDFVSQAVGVEIGEKGVPPTAQQDSVKHEELTSSQEVVTNTYNDPLESCAVKAEDSLKDADIESDAAMLSQNKDPVVQSNVMLETISLTEKQAALDLSRSEDKNLSEECVFTELLAISSGEEESCCNSVNSIFSVSESWSTINSDKNDVETGFTESDSDLSLKSNDTVSGRTDENVLLTESPIHEEKDGWNLDQIEDLISSLETVEVDLLDRNSENSSMESITLSDEENLHESCVVVHSTPVYSFSSRPRKYKSYKKIIQDAFNSRKRIVKEYEQLEILYGNIDNDRDEIKALIASKTFKAKISASEENEWEVI